MNRSFIAVVLALVVCLSALGAGTALGHPGGAHHARGHRFATRHAIGYHFHSAARLRSHPPAFARDSARAARAHRRAYRAARARAARAHRRAYRAARAHRRARAARAHRRARAARAHRRAYRAARVRAARAHRRAYRAARRRTARDRAHRAHRRHFAPSRSVGRFALSELIRFAQSGHAVRPRRPRRAQRLMAARDRARAIAASGFLGIPAYLGLPAYLAPTPHPRAYVPRSPAPSRGGGSVYRPVTTPAAGIVASASAAGAYLRTTRAPVHRANAPRPIPAYRTAPSPPHLSGLPASPVVKTIERVVSVIPGFVWLLLAIAGGALGAVGAAAVRSSRYARRQADELAAVAAAARTDLLTGVLNRRGFSEAVTREIGRARRYARPFALSYLDVRGLKAVNDSLGHQVGDAVLREVADMLETSARDTDAIGRLGGDEFALLLGEQTAESAAAVVERICAAVPERRAALDLGVPWDLTIGTAVFPDDGETIEALLEVADRRLYEQRGIELRETQIRRRRRRPLSAPPTATTPPTPPTATATATQTDTPAPV